MRRSAAIVIDDQSVEVSQSAVDDYRAPDGVQRVGGAPNEDQVVSRARVDRERAIGATHEEHVVAAGAVDHISGRCTDVGRSEDAEGVSAAAGVDSQGG